MIYSIVDPYFCHRASCAVAVASISADRQNLVFMFMLNPCMNKGKYHLSEVCRNTPPAEIAFQVSRPEPTPDCDKICFI